MGTPDFAVGTLDALHEAGHEILAAVSQPDKPKGRHSELQPTPVSSGRQSWGSRYCSRSGLMIRLFWKS